jgi:hypothetical protein
MNHVAPSFEADAFNCPHCGAYSHQYWITLEIDIHNNTYYTDTNFTRSECKRCKDYLFWHNENIIVPDVSGAPIPNKDMPELVKDAYEEARSISSKSPRGAAALLRLGVQLLCIELGYKGKNINTDIGKMVEDGLPNRIQKALDAVRVIGNQAVHPGVINFEDKPETSAQLFNLLNFIVEKMITEPNSIDNFFDTELPQAAKEGIENRDRDVDSEE